MDLKEEEYLGRAWSFLKRRFKRGEQYGLKLTLALLSLVASLYFFGDLVEDVVEAETILYVDDVVQQLVESLISPKMTLVMVRITALGSSYFIGLTSFLIFLYLIYKGDNRNIVALILVVGVGEALISILKRTIHRARPLHSLVAVHGYSFPSGHAFATMLVFGFLTYLTWISTTRVSIRLAVLGGSILTILVVGVSRIYLNVHWLTDVLGGYCAGFSWLIFSILSVNMFRRPRSAD